MASCSGWDHTRNKPRGSSTEVRAEVELDLDVGQLIQRPALRRRAQRAGARRADGHPSHMSLDS